ncbi:MAG: pilus assembly protein, partial [Octadecabacter sp.]
FALIFMPFLLIPVSGFELGLLMTRHVMVERGLDMAVREVRLNTGIPLTETQVKTMICNSAGIIPNCMVNLRLEMRNIDLRHTGSNASNQIPRTASCTNLSNPAQAPRNYTNGTPNQMMIVRACGLFSPMLPEFGLGYFLSRMRSDGHYPLVSTTAYVMEPV